jgi:hypothetical protein
LADLSTAVCDATSTLKSHAPTTYGGCGSGRGIATATLSASVSTRSQIRGLSIFPLNMPSGPSRDMAAK